jgi:hypothetical protein
VNEGYCCDGIVALATDKLMQCRRCGKVQDNATSLTRKKILLIRKFKLRCVSLKLIINASRIVTGER